MFNGKRIKYLEEEIRILENQFRHLCNTLGFEHEPFYENCRIKQINMILDYLKLEEVKEPAKTYLRKIEEPKNGK